jgi:diaminohydroxyphosphoribosylaminopyrimidine deaminase/5-amino-6-(5-phosphoribosylamino)uracil reductase
MEEGVGYGFAQIRPVVSSPRGFSHSGTMPGKRTGNDVEFMQRALQLAELGRGRTAPNPIVGAVVTRAGRIVGEGWHCRPGTDHAEIVALRQAGRAARGGTLYVTLEPCAHIGRTPPCVDAVIAAGIARCVVAIQDPHAIVDGRGLRALRRAGVRVEVGLIAEEVREALGGYLLAHTAGRPRVTWKVAASLDGRAADRTGRSQWITGRAARKHGHHLRAGSDAIVIGSRTARLDDPRLTARGAGPVPVPVRQPLRVVCDTRLALPRRLRLLRAPLARGTVVACGPQAPARNEAALVRAGVRVWRLPLLRGAVSPRALARRLAAEGCHEVLLESGGRLGSAWLDAGLVDRLALFTAPLLLGADAQAWCGPLGRPLARAPRGRVLERVRLDPDDFVLIGLAAETP